MTGIVASDVLITNVTSTTTAGRRLLDALTHLRRLAASPSSAPTSSSSSGILAAYIVNSTTPYTQSALQSQLNAAVSSGTFNTQLTTFAKQYGAAGFVNATSAAIVFATVAPTPSPVSVATDDSANNKASLSGGAIAGIVIMCVVVVAACVAGLYWYYHHLQPHSYHKRGTLLDEDGSGISPIFENRRSTSSNLSTGPSGIFQSNPMSRKSDTRQSYLDSDNQTY